MILFVNSSSPPHTTHLFSCCCSLSVPGVCILFGSTAFNYCVLLSEESSILTSLGWQIPSTSHFEPQASVTVWIPFPGILIVASLLFFLPVCGVDVKSSYLQCLLLSVGTVPSCTSTLGDCPRGYTERGRVVIFTPELPPMMDIYIGFTGSHPYIRTVSNYQVSWVYPLYHRRLVC